MKEQLAILLVSAARTGSSCFMGCMQLCGVFLGRHQATVKNRFNPKGYFESSKILNFNILLERQLGVRFWTVGVAEGRKHKARLRALLRDEYQGVPVFGIKDPRMYRFGSLYEEAVLSMPASIKVIVYTREKAACLKAMKAFRSKDTRKLPPDYYDQFYREGRKLAEKHPSIDVRFEDLLEETKKTMRRVCEFIDHPSVEYNPEVVDFVDPNLVHWK